MDKLVRRIEIPLAKRVIEKAGLYKEANVGLYRHYGFDLMKEEPIPKSTVMHYAMVRKPMYENEVKWRKTK